MELYLEKKIVLIAGGSGGIGLDACKLFLKEGSIVIIIDRTKPIIKFNHKNFFFFKSNLSNEKDIKNLVEKIIKKFKRVNILINSIGIFSSKDILSLSEKNISDLFHKNFIITSLLTKFILKTMLKNKDGKIINIGSIAGQNGGIFAGDLYSVSKASIINITKSIAKKYGKQNIYCNCINPGPLESKMTKSWPKKIKSNLIKQFNIKNLKNLGSTEDVANIILFLSSKRSKLIQGAEINANGGIII